MAKVRLVGATKKFGDVVAVKDVSFEVKDKEFLILVGPSGCGKSTTLRMIAGLEDVTKGEIYIGDELVNDLSPKDRDVAMVFQNYALYPHMNVYENMSFSLRLKKFPKDEIDERVYNAAKLLRIEELLDRKPKELSGGQRQRVAVGRAIVRKPKVFLFDEPLSNLDAKLRTQMRAELILLHRELKTTSIYVTHDQIEAMTMGTRLVILKDGEIQQIDTPQKLYDHPKNQFVASFIGSPSMNFIDATIVDEDDILYLDAGSFTVKIPMEFKDLLAEYVKKDVIFGIRPEDIYDVNSAPSEIKTNTIEAKIELIEPLGSEILLHLKKADKEIIAKMDARTKLRSNENMYIALDTTKMHIFDKKNGKTIF